MSNPNPVYTTDEILPRREVEEPLASRVRGLVEAGAADEILDLLSKVDQNARSWGVAHGRALERGEIGP